MSERTYKSYLIDKIKATASTNPDTAKRIRKKCLYQEDYSKKINKSGIFTKKPDFDVFVDKNQNDIFIISDFRGVSITCKDLAFMLAKGDQEKADADWEYLLNLIAKADELFAPESQEDIDNGLWLNMLIVEYEKMMLEETHRNFLVEKRETKHQAKAEAKYKFRVRQKYSLRSFSLEGVMTNYDAFECRQIVYTIGRSTVNTVVMKRLTDGTKRSNRCLTPFDCRILHIKYESELYMYSMNQRFYPETDESIQENRQKVQKRVQLIEASEPKQKSATELLIKEPIIYESELIKAAEEKILETNAVPADALEENKVTLMTVERPDGKGGKEYGIKAVDRYGRELKQDQDRHGYIKNSDAESYWRPMKIL